MRDIAQYHDQVTVFQHESALRVMVGGVEVMREQLQHLLEAIELPNVVFRVIPFAAGLPTPHLSMLEFGGGASPVLVSGSFGTVNSIGNPTQAELARHYFRKAEQHAAPAEASPAILKEALDSI